MADRIAWTATLKRDAEKNNNSFGSSYYDLDEMDGQYATLVRTRHPETSYQEPPSAQNGKCCPACSPRFTYAFSCGLALFAFLVAVNVHTLPELSRLIPPWSTFNEQYCPIETTSNSTIDRVCWQSPFLGNLLEEEYQLNNMVEIVIGIICLWGFHFLRRFGEIMFLHDYRRKVWKTEFILLPIYHLIFGFWIGWSCNFHLVRYNPPFYPILASGGVLFVVGEVGNCASHIKLYHLRNRPYSKMQMELTPSQHILPNGFLFQVICCPHYLFEIITWLGFAMATCTLASYVFALFTLVILAVKGRMRYSAYCKEFHGRHKVPRYEKNRKSLIPFIF